VSNVSTEKENNTDRINQSEDDILDSISIPDIDYAERKKLMD
jgi:hypothetical protein